MSHEVLRYNRNLRLLESAARTESSVSDDQDNWNMRGIIVVLDVTDAGSGEVTLTIEGKDQVSGKYYTILTGAAVSTDVTTVYRVYPGLTPVENLTVSDILPRTFRVSVAHTDANPITYSVGACLVW